MILFCDLIPVKKLSKLCEIFEILVNGACLKTFILQMKNNIDFQSAKQIDIENIPGCSRRFAKLIVKKRKELSPSKLDCDIVCDLIPVKKLSKWCETFNILVNGACLKTCILQMKNNIDFQSAKQIDIENIPGCSRRFAKLIVKKREELLPSKLDCDIVCDLIPVKKLSKWCESFEILVNGKSLNSFLQIYGDETQSRFNKYFYVRKRVACKKIGSRKMECWKNSVY